MSDDADFVKERVWDLPTRLFHWLLVISVSAGWYLGDNMSFTTIEWHILLGYATGGLIAFRIVWGFIGPPSARLSALVPKPTEVVRYLRHVAKREPSGVPGHNPLGSLAVLALLATLTVQVSTGLFAESDDYFDSGPLAPYVDNAVVLFCNNIHAISSDVLLGLVALHIAALVFYLVWKRENLIAAMITGAKLVRRPRSSGDASR